MTASPRKSSLLVIFLTVFIDLLGFGMVLPLLPIYAEHFTVDESGWLIGALMASFSLMQFLFSPVWGRWSDRIGRRPVLMIGLAGSVVFYTLFGIATVERSLWLLFISRIGAGIAGATIPTAQAYIADCTTFDQRHKGMALIGMAFGLGFTFGPLFGYLAVPSGQGDPGPWPGYAAGALSAAAFLLAAFRLPESLKPESVPAARRLFDFSSLRESLATPSILALLVTMFVCVFSFANFETTLSMLIKKEHGVQFASPFGFDWRQVCLTYAFIGITLALVQGGLVRRMAGHVSEANLSAVGAVVEMIGFGLMLQAIQSESTGLLFTALATVVTGFAFLQPSLNSLLSRRSDPAKQGGILGLAQSVNSLARIVGAFLGIPLLKAQIGLPFLSAAGLMGVGLLLVLSAGRRGKDFAPIVRPQS